MSYSEEILAALRGERFLHDIDEQYLRLIAPIAEIREFPAEIVLFREGQHHSHIYLVLEGSFALEIRVPGQEPKRLQTVGDGELLGWSPVLGQVEMTATVRALRQSRVIAINATQLVALCEHNPRFGFEFMRRTAQALSNRLSATKLQLLDVYSHLPPVAHVIVEG